MFQNLDRLKVFHYVFAEKSAVAAATRLHVSQSAVSQSIQKLEKEINTPLFTRLHKQLVPTAAGERLYGIVQPFIATLDVYLKELEQAKGHPVGEIRFGAPPEFGKAYLPRIIARFREKYPDVTFSLEFGLPETLLSLIKKGSLDFALADLFLTRSASIGSLEMYQFTPIVEEVVVLACSKEYYERSIRGDLSYGSLAKQDYISYNPDLQTIIQWFKHHFSKPNVSVNTVLTVDNHDAVIEAIKNDVGLGIVVSHLIQDELFEEQIIHLKPSATKMINQISLVHLQDKIPTFTEKMFERFLIDSITEMLATGREGLRPA